VTATDASATGRGETREPYLAYATLMATFLGGVALVAAVGARRRRGLPAAGPFDLAVLGLATFKAARTVARDEVTSFIREPFVEENAPADDETPVQTGGARQAIGELVTCSRCIGTWIAAGIAAVDTLMPRAGRLLSWCLAVGGMNDWLQAGFAALTASANRLDRE
jgi:Protein of unknown function (DUF1360)